MERGRIGQSSKQILYEAAKKEILSVIAYCVLVLAICAPHETRMPTMRHELGKYNHNRTVAE